MDEPRVVKTTKGERDVPRWFASSFAVLQGLKAGQIDIALPDGRVFRVEGPELGPAARIEVRHPGLFARVGRRSRRRKIRPRLPRKAPQSKGFTNRTDSAQSGA